jgi:hypothetical protein
MKNPTRRGFLAGALTGAAVVSTAVVLDKIGAGVTPASAGTGPEVCKSVPSIPMGNTIPNLAFQAGMYDAGRTQRASDTLFCNIVGRGIGGGQHLPITKKFWNQGDWSLTKNDLANYAAFGTTVIFAVWPASPASKSERANLASFLTGIKRIGFGAHNAFLVPWQEPESKVSPAEFQAGLEFYGPTITAAGFPLVADIGTGEGPTLMGDLGAAAIAAMNKGVQLAGLAQDFYAPQHIAHGATLDILAGLADSNRIPFGVFESGVVPSKFGVTASTDYLNYIGDFMSTRNQAGKRSLAWLYYDGQGQPTGAGDLTSPIGQDPSVAKPDFRAALWRGWYDKLCALS